MAGAPSATDFHGGRVELGPALVHLLPVHADVAGGLDADAHLVPLDRHDGHLNVTVDHDLLAGVAGENQHDRPSLGGRTGLSALEGSAAHEPVSLGLGVVIPFVASCA